MEISSQDFLVLSVRTWNYFFRQGLNDPPPRVFLRAMRKVRDPRVRAVSDILGLPLYITGLPLCR